MGFPEKSWNALKVFTNVWKSSPPSVAALKSGKDEAPTPQNIGFSPIEGSKTKRQFISSLERRVLAYGASIKYHVFTQ